MKQTNSSLFQIIFNVFMFGLVVFLAGPKRLLFATDGELIPKTSVMANASDGVVVDIMVVYTSEARYAAGSRKDIEEKIDYAIDQTNQIFMNSEIKTRMRLVHKMETAYTESVYDKENNPWPDDTDIAYLNNPSDGIMDGVFTQRDEFGADLVAFIKTGSGGCFRPEIGKNGKYTFLVGLTNATKNSNLTFAHELGHAFGCSHGGGWDYMVAGQRMTTVMAYHSEKPPEFPMVGQKVPYFSNPNVLDRGVPTGSSTSNNARTLDAMAPTVANYKDSVPAAPVPTHFQASEGKGSLLCTWDAVPDPVFYRVYAAE
jgi:peptidyl-Asp metalloendopeptidase